MKKQKPAGHKAKKNPVRSASPANVKGQEQGAVIRHWSGVLRADLIPNMREGDPWTLKEICTWCEDVERPRVPPAVMGMIVDVLVNNGDLRRVDGGYARPFSGEQESAHGA